MKQEFVQTKIPHCAFCGGKVPSGRSDIVYCTHNCKMKAYRWRKRANRYESKAIENIVNIGNYIDYPETQPLAIASLRQLKTYIDDTLKVHNVHKAKVNGS
jgi:predicted nucleic acid-binding Zn ribbon protein